MALALIGAALVARGLEIARFTSGSGLTRSPRTTSWGPFPVPWNTPSQSRRWTERSHWVVRGPLGSQLAWQARIVNEREGEMIAWESLPGAEVSNAGSVWFEPPPTERLSAAPL
jgi:hypothetical protein